MASDQSMSRLLRGATARRLGRSGDRVKGEYGRLKGARGLPEALLHALARRPAEQLAGLGEIDLQGTDKPVSDGALSDGGSCEGQYRGRNRHDPGGASQGPRHPAEQLG